MKKIAFVLAVLLLGVLLPVSAGAQTWSGPDFTLEIPDGFYQFTPSTPEDDPVWALAGIGDAAAKLKEYQEMGVLVELAPKEGGKALSLIRKQSDYAKSVFDLRLLSQEEQDKVLQELLQSNSESLTLDKSWFPVGDYLFYRVQLDLVPTEDEGTQTQELHELIYGTIINGYALNFHLFGNADPIEPEEARALEELVGSIQFTQVLSKPEADMANLRNSLLLLGLMLAAVVAPLIYVPLKNKSDKKKKAQLAEQLSEYHKTHGPNEVEGQPLFANDTDCTKEAIHHFSMYQALVKNMGELIFGALTCVIMVSAAFLIDSEWWMKLAAVAVSGYYAYKLAFMPTSIEKIQRKVYGRGPSQTAPYVFYPEAFRVSGIQAASVVPYFQLTDLRRKGQYLYLYYGPDNAYMVDQYGFTQGEAEEFARFIGEKMRKQK